MLGDDDYRQRFHRGGVEAHLACGGGGCGMDFATDQSDPALRFEVLYQPRDRDGLPWSLARRVWDSVVPLWPSGAGARGHVELPGRLRAELLRECHFRITPTDPEP